MKKGFTLIELLVVIAIMGILTVITVSQFQTAKRKANDVARKGDLNAVSKALQMYFADYGYLPTSDPASGGEVEGAGWGEEFNDGGYVYMKVMPQENKLNWTDYCYKTDTDRKKYALFARLENENDSECVGRYFCNGNEYCFAYVSPNTKLGQNGNFE
jgi:type II secretion system protein G